MKLISWNVNGLRAVVGKGFMDIFKELDADVFCLQETKLQAGQIELELPGYEQYWNLSLIHILCTYVGVFSPGLWWGLCRGNAG